MIFSKDEELLEAPFPIMCGISRELYIKTEKAGVNEPDRIVFDLDKGEVVLPKALQYLQAPRKKSKSSATEEQAEIKKTIETEAEKSIIHSLWYISHKTKFEELERLHQTHFNSTNSHLLQIDRETHKISINLFPGDEVIEEDQNGDMTVEYFQLWHQLWSEHIIAAIGDLKMSGAELSAEKVAGKATTRAFWLREYISNFSKTQIFQCFVSRCGAACGDMSTKSNRRSSASQDLPNQQPAGF